jgi:Pyridoxamine 5'-phosphate oxidase
VHWRRDFGRPTHSLSTAELVELSQTIAFARGRHQGVVITLRRDGRPQVSNISYLMEDDGSTRVSVTESRAKTKNLRREQRM